MIINNVLLKLKNKDIESVNEAKSVILSMKGKIEVLIDIQVELNNCPGQTKYDLMFITKFASLEDMESYLKHPVHLEVGKFIGSVLEEQASLCYEA